MDIYAKILRVTRNAEGTQYQTVFLLHPCDPTAPMWTTDGKHAAVLRWEEADKLAPQVGGHAVVQAGSGETHVEHARIPQGDTRREKAVNHHRHLWQTCQTRRKAREEANVMQFHQSEMESRKLA